MKLLVRFRIQEVVSQWISNAPYKLVLEPDEGSHDLENSTIVLDDDTLKFFGLELSLGMTGSLLEIEFESKTEFVGEEYRRLAQLEELARLKIFELSDLRIKRILPYVEPQWNTTQNRLLFIGTNVMQDAPCPLYKFDLELNESQFAEAELLTADTFFIVTSMRVIDKPARSSESDMPDKF